MQIEHIIFSNLVLNAQYQKKTIAFLRDEYFHDANDKIVFGLIDEYVKKYNSFPSQQALIIDLQNKNGVSEASFKACTEIINSLVIDPDTELQWLFDQTEKFCQEKAIYNGIMKSIQIIDDKTGKLSKGSIPQILSDSLAVSFDTHIGHDLLENTEEQYAYYHKKEIRIPFDLDYFNKITNGGLPRKTLNIVIAGTNVGKSMFMCHCAAGNLTNGFNVLYITMEMAEHEIAKRIECNLLDISLDEIKIIPKQQYDKRVERLKSQTAGKLIIKEYPTAMAGSANFRHLLNELKIKKQFVPDIVYIDYLNICMSSRLKYGANVNSYTYIKTIAEEIRGLAVEYNVPIFSATQTTRSGYTSSDIGLEDTSESFGLPATADFMIALISSEELEQLNQLMVKQLKNRYNDTTTIKRFVVGVDRSKMRLYDCEQAAQKNIIDGPVMDKTEFGEKDYERQFGSKKFEKSLFESFT